MADSVLNRKLPQNKNKMEKLKKLINKNFKVHLYGFDSQQKLVNTFVGSKFFMNEIGAELADSITQKAIKAGKDKFKYRLRRGITVTLYSK